MRVKGDQVLFRDVQRQVNGWPEPVTREYAVRSSQHSLNDQVSGMLRNFREQSQSRLGEKEIIRTNAVHGPLFASSYRESKDGFDNQITTKAKSDSANLKAIALLPVIAELTDSYDKLMLSKIEPYYGGHTHKPTEEKIVFAGNIKGVTVNRCLVSYF